RGSMLGVNGSDTVQVTARLDPVQKNGVSSSVVVVADESDPAAGNNQSTAGTAVERQAGILVQIGGGPHPVAASRDLTYTLTIQNAGPSTAEAIAVTDTLPVGVIFKGYTSSDWTCQHNAGVVTCDPLLLQPGASGTIQIVVTTPSEQGVIENQASVTSSTPDSQTGNNSASTFTSVTAETDLSIQIGVNNDPAQAGIPLEYTLAVENLGVSSTSAISLTFALPAGGGDASGSRSGPGPLFFGGVILPEMLFRVQWPNCRSGRRRQ
nr:DUF11 domain-containing protein [Anaerolinea sp.]